MLLVVFYLEFSRVRSRPERVLRPARLNSTTPDIALAGLTTATLGRDFAKTAQGYGHGFKLRTRHRIGATQNSYEDYRNVNIALGMKPCWTSVLINGMEGMTREAAIPVRALKSTCRRP
jgi:hypothetical protein